MNILPTIGKENGENCLPLSKQRYISKRGIDTGPRVLGTNYRHPHANMTPRKRSSLRDGERKLYTQKKEDGDTSSSASIDLNLNETLGNQEWSNNGNGVYIHSPRKQVHIHDGTHRKPYHHAESCPFEPFACTQRPGLQRRHTTQSPLKERGISISDVSYLDSAPINRPLCRRTRPIPVKSWDTKYSATTKRRNVVMAMAVGISLLGYFVEIRQMTRQMMNLKVRGGSMPSDWLVSLPSSISISILGRSGQSGNVMGDAYFPQPTPNVRLMEAERKLVHSRSKTRAERRRMRTKPPSTYPTMPLAATVSGGAAAVVDVPQGPSPPAPRLILDLPAHRELDNVKVDRKYQQADSEKNSEGRRRLLRTNQKPEQSKSPCGPQAEEASQHNPSNYPESAYIGPKSRIVVTGALSQVGIELILQLHEQCRVQFIVGIDSAYPNTRHERIDMIESRYQYIQRRVPGFQRLMVPMFGIHPHPKMGEERMKERTGNGFDLVRRLNPTHIVHLAGMEEGRGEYIDYGDTLDASPFAEGGKRSMMRRFDSLLSTDQVFSSVAKFNKLQVEGSHDIKQQPQLVYVSSNEANDQSGVLLKNGASAPYPASVYGMVCLLKEVLASFYHRHHGVDSIGLRVPTIFGPFSRPGSLLHDLTERTLRNAAGEEGVPKYHFDRDRYELNSMWPKRDGATSGVTEEMVYVYDVASAIVAAMQFKKNSGSKPSVDPNSGPTLIRVGSNMTVSMNGLKKRMEGCLPLADQREAPEAAPNDVSLNSVGVSTYDAERTQDLISWVPETGLHEGIKSMLAWQVLKAFPFGLAESLPSHAAFLSLLEDSFPSLSHHSLPCASGCRWGGGMCSKSPWDAVIDTTKELTKKCAYVIYTVDLRPELDNLEKQSIPSKRKGWEELFCKIAFVSTSSKLAEKVYTSELKGKVPINDWNGKSKTGSWIIVALRGSQYTMAEYERSMAKLTPAKLFSSSVERAMYIDHRRVILSTDQAMGVMRHMEMNSRDTPAKQTITDKHRHSIFFTNKYSFADDFDYSSTSDFATFVMSNNGIAETEDIRNQIKFYEHASQLTRMNMLRSPNYQQMLVLGDNFFPYDFLRSTWLVHTLKSEEGRHLRCEMYEEHALWGNAGMEDLSMGYVLAKWKVKMQLGSIAEPQDDSPGEWYPLLVPKEPKDEGAITEGSVYFDYIATTQKVATDSGGHEYYITFLPQKQKK